MSEKEKKREQSIRLFEALSNVSPELLARSEKKKAKKGFRTGWSRYVSYAAACLAILLVGGISLYSMKYFESETAKESAMFSANKAEGFLASVRQGFAAEQAGDEEMSGGGFSAGEKAEEQKVEKQKAEEQKAEEQKAENELEGADVGGDAAQTERESNQIEGTAADDPQMNAYLDKNMSGDVRDNTELSEEQLPELGSSLQSVTEQQLIGMSGSKQSVAEYLSEEDVTSMGSLAAYVPASLPQGYSVSDTRVSVDESGIGGYVIVMQSREGDVLEYCVSRGRKAAQEYPEESEETDVIYVTDLQSEKLSAELVKAEEDGQRAKPVVVLYGDDVSVEVRGDYTLEILQEIYPDV